MHNSMKIKNKISSIDNIKIKYSRNTIIYHSIQFSTKAILCRSTMKLCNTTVKLCNTTVKLCNTKIILCIHLEIQLKITFTK